MLTPVKRILVVDDDADFVAYLSTVLQETGHSVATALDGEEALSQVQNASPDLVILDVQMPKKSGIIFYRQVRSDARFRSIPVIVLSGMLRGGDCTPGFVKRFFELDGLPTPERFLDKTIDKRSLLAAVTELLSASPTEGGASRE